MMTSRTPKSANNLTVNQLQFIEWLATPKSERTPKTQKEFAAVIGTDEGTLSDWKKKAGFMDEVRGLARKYLKDELPDIYGALIEKAKTGDVPAIKLAMEMTGEYTPKQNIQMDLSKLSDDELRTIAES
jgi:hypothetical protein